MSDLVPYKDPSLTKREQNPLSPIVPRHLRSKFLWLPDDARSMGIHIVAGKGSGKSRLMGRILCWLDFVRGVPLVILDPNGPLIDNFLDKLVRLPPAYQKQLSKRVLYVDMSARGGHVVPLPLFYRLGRESIYEISQRPLDVIRRTDPALGNAPVEGWNALWRIGTHIGMVLSALGYQITEADDLLHNPEAWSGRFAAAVRAYPEAASAVGFFTKQYAEWDDKTRARRIDSFINKTAIFGLDPAMKAIFGADTPGIDWQQVIDGGYAILLDFRHEYDLERRRFKMLWAFEFFMSFIKQRGAGHRHKPVSLVIDELASLLNAQSQTANLFAQDLDEIINVIARNYRVWLTIAHQEMFQLDEKTQKTLMTMGTQVFGSTSDMDAALSLARHFFRIDPLKVKRYEPIYVTNQGITKVLDYQPVEYSIEEQQYLRSYDVKDQPAFHFLVRPARAEGDATGGVYPITIRNFDKDIWVNEGRVAQARDILRKRSGVPIGDVLADIDLRLPGADRPATINRYASNQSSVHLAAPHSSTDGEDDVLREEKK